MSSIVGMTTVIYGSNREERLRHINGIIDGLKQKHTVVLVDFLEVDKNSIGIAEIRTLIEKSNYTSLHAQHRVFVIHHAHKLTDQAQNALLKLYEEPNADSTYLLELDSYQSLLPTIISRVVLTDVSSGFDSGLLEKLIAEHEFPSKEDLQKLKLPELFKLCEEYGKDKKVARDFITYISVIVRDLLRTTGESRRKQFVLFSEFLLQASEWIAETNVNARLLLENCVLGWWNLMK